MDLPLKVQPHEVCERLEESCSAARQLAIIRASPLGAARDIGERPDWHWQAEAGAACKIPSYPRPALRRVERCYLAQARSLRQSTNLGQEL